MESRPMGARSDEIRLEVAGKVAHGVHLGGLGDIAALDTSAMTGYQPCGQRLGISA